MRVFSVEQGIKVQEEALKQWEVVLKPSVLAKLTEFARATNSKAKTGYEIRRGSDLSNFIANYKE